MLFGIGVERARTTIVADAGQGLSGTLKTWIGVAVAGVGLLAGWSTYQADRFKNNETRACQVSGQAVDRFTGTPAANVRLGFRPQNGASEFEFLARTDAEGSFSASCEAARRSTSGGTFELLAQGNFRGESLPCLAPSDLSTGTFIDREGSSSGVVVQVKGC
jgi:hypothetical protein